jgi:hypothetical protein
MRGVGGGKKKRRRRRGGGCFCFMKNIVDWK